MVKGIVKNITDYGAFVDLGGIDGLLHITDLAWRRVKHPSEVLNVGDEVTAKVLKFDAEKNRVSLGLKQLGEDPWVGISRRYPQGTRLFGKVTNLTDYGAFVEVEAGIEGLVHVSEMDWTNKNVHPSKVVQVGDEVEVMILEIDEERRRISLGMKQCMPNPWEDFAREFKKGDRVKGQIKSITDFGVFVGLPGGIDGLVHLSDLSWSPAGEEAVKNFKKGDEVEAVVLSIDVERERISLGIKQLEGDPFTNFIAGHDKNSVVQGTVKSRGRQGRGDRAHAARSRATCAPPSSRATASRTCARVLKEGDTVSAMIINVDRKNRSINLSVKAKDVAEETDAMKQLRTENAASAAGSPTSARCCGPSSTRATPTRSSSRAGPTTRGEAVAMTKSELIARLAQRYPQLVAKDAEYAVKMILDAMTQRLLSGHRIEIRGFGSFGLNYRPPRVGRNPKSGEKVHVPEKYVPHFKAGKELRERVDARRPRRLPSRRERASRPPAKAAGRIRGPCAMRIVTWAIRLAAVPRCCSRSPRRTPSRSTLRFYFDLAWQAPLVRGAARVLRRRRAVRRARACSAPLLRQRREIGACGGRRRRRRDRAPPPARGGLMEFEYWWLLGFPLFFGLGWLAARIDIRHLVHESRALPRSYFKGLNFLLNEQPDKAIEAFIEVVKVDPETVELHFALGSLFRRRGEYDRAIRMHQNLLERADLAAEQRTAALFELGAGLPEGRASSTAPRRLFGRLADRARTRPRRAATCSRSTSRRRTGAKAIDDGAAAGDRDRASRARRRSRSSSASWRPPRATHSRPDAARAATSRRRWRRTASACAPACSWAISRTRGGQPRARDRALEAGRVAESGLSRAGGAAPARRAPRGGPARGRA